MNKAWKEGDEVAFEVCAYGTLKVNAGLFWYCGWGMGDYYSKSGNILWMSSTQATDQAKTEGVELNWQNSFKGFTGTAVGDR